MTRTTTTTRSKTRSNTALAKNCSSELLQLAVHLGLDHCSSRMPRQTVLRELAMHVALAVPEYERAVYVETVLQMDLQPDQAVQPHQDPGLEVSVPCPPRGKAGAPRVLKWGKRIGLDPGTGVTGSGADGAQL